MFKDKPVGIEGVESLKWVLDDKNAFKLILRDWKECKEDFLRFVKKFDSVVQAGGNCGMYPRFYGNYFKNVYTFEPDNANFLALKENCQSTEATTYHCYEFALGDKTDKVYLDTSCKINNGKHFIDPEKEGDIPQITLDSLNLLNCDLIHYDIEGYELNALKGSLETIKKYKPVIILEMHFAEKDILNFMKQINYRLVKKLRNDSIFLPN